MSDSGLGLFYVEFSTPLCVNGAQSCTINVTPCKWRQYYIKEINAVDYEFIQVILFINPKVFWRQLTLS